MAFTVTKDLLLPATVTGSWPRPRWYTANLWGRPLDTAVMDPWFREQFTDAHQTVVADQARAGLDVLTTGDYHLDEDAAGRSWHHYPLQRWKGLEHEELQTERTRSPLLSYPVGTMLDSIYKTWRWPRVVGRVEHDPKNPLEYAKIWRIAQQAAAVGGKPVKFGTCSAQVLAFFLDNRHLAFYKTIGTPLARNIVLKELGVEPRYVPAADEKLAWDQLPDFEPFTHLKPLR